MPYLSTIINNGICVTATTNVMKNKRIRNGNIVLHGELHGPAVATGTTVTSAKSPLLAAPGGSVMFP